jgi:hypothetical protein
MGIHERTRSELIESIAEPGKLLSQPQRNGSPQFYKPLNQPAVARWLAEGFIFHGWPLQFRRQAAGAQPVSPDRFHHLPQAAERNLACPKIYTRYNGRWKSSFKLIPLVLVAIVDKFPNFNRFLV